MKRLFVFLFTFFWGVMAHAFTVNIRSNDLQLDPVFSNLNFFTLSIDISDPLQPGRSYTNPVINQVSYRIRGTLQPGVPSGDTNFDNTRTVTGDVFYSQGSTLSFTISDTAVLRDGLQVAELAGNGIVFNFDGRETNSNNFRAPLLVLNADGSGSIRNSNNVIAATPPLVVNAGEEYITNLMFDTGNTTLISNSSNGGGNSSNDSVGGGAFGLISLFIPVVVFAARRRRV